MRCRRRHRGRSRRHWSLTLVARWHWLSLDAVTVLVAYQWALEAAAGVSIPGWAAAFLGAGVWCGYIADRLLDVVRDPARSRVSERHAFHDRHRRALSIVWCGLVGVLFAVGWARLPELAWQGGLLAALLGALYVWQFSGRGGRFPEEPHWRWGKRISTVSLLVLAGGWWMIWRPPSEIVSPLGVMGIFGLAAWWSLSLLHHRLVAPLSWYSLSARICGGGMLVVSLLCFRSWTPVLPVVLLILFLAVTARRPLPNGSCNGEWGRDPALQASFLPACVDAALACALLLLGWTL